MIHSITLQQAIDMTTLFRDQLNNIVNPRYIGQDIIARCETFDRTIIDAILAETGCVKLRVYSGLNADLHLKVIIVGVDDQDKDILPTAARLADGEEIYIAEEGISCPPYCRPDPNPPLNP
jgi:hypothetical protein